MTAGEGPLNQSREVVVTDKLFEQTWVQILVSVAY